VGKFILAITLLLLVFGFEPPATLNGKWKVDAVKVSPINDKATPKQKAMFLAQTKKMLIGQVFDFRDGQAFYMSPGVATMPGNLKWAYNASTGILLITEANDPGSWIFDIAASEQDGKVIFTIRDAPVVLTMHRL
jgi:hypothetical protein